MSGVSVGQIGIVIFTAVGVAFAFRWVARRSRYAVADADTCARCGYIVHGLPSATCPECGSDLSRPGAVRPRGWRTTMPRDWWIVAWSAAFWLGFWAVNAAWFNRLPEVRQFEMTVTLSRPYSEAFESIELTYAGEIYQQEPLSGRGRLVLIGHQGAKSELHVEAVGAAIQVASESGGGKLVPETILERLRAAGVEDVSAPAVRLDAQDVVALAGAVAMDNTRRPGRRFSAEGLNASGDSRAIYPITAARWALALVWLTACVMLWRADRVRA
jgi:hypothetical protein